MDIVAIFFKQRRAAHCSLLMPTGPQCLRGTLRNQRLVRPFHVTEEGTEAQMAEAACPGSQGKKMEEDLLFS